MSMLRHKAGWTVRGSGEFTSSDDDSDSDAPEASTPKRATLATKNPIPACSTAATAQAVVPESNATQEDVAPTSTGNEAGHYATDSVHSFGAYLCKFSRDRGIRETEPLNGNSCTKWIAFVFGSLWAIASHIHVAFTCKSAATGKVLSHAPSVTACIVALADASLR